MSASVSLLYSLDVIEHEPAETEAGEAGEDQRVGQAQPQPPARAQAAHQDRLEPHVDILDLTVWTSYYVDILLCGHLTM